MEERHEETHQFPEPETNVSFTCVSLCEGRSKGLYPSRAMDVPNEQTKILKLLNQGNTKPFCVVF